MLYLDLSPTMIELHIKARTTIYLMDIETYHIRCSTIAYYEGIVDYDF